MRQEDYTIEQATGASMRTWIERWRAAAHAHDRSMIGPLAQLLWMHGAELAEVLAYARSVMTPRLADDLIEHQVWWMMRRTSTTVELEIDRGVNKPGSVEPQHLHIDHWIKGTVPSSQCIRVQGSCWVGGAIDEVWRVSVVAKVRELWDHFYWPHSGPRDRSMAEAALAGDMRSSASPGRVIHHAGEVIARSVKGEWEDRNRFAAEFRRWACEERIRCWLKVRFQLPPHAEFLRAVVAEERAAEAHARKLAEEVASNSYRVKGVKVTIAGRNLGGGSTTYG